MIKTKFLPVDFLTAASSSEVPHELLLLTKLLTKKKKAQIYTRGICACPGKL
jgi:hypothetical protein